MPSTSRSRANKKNASTGGTKKVISHGGRRTAAKGGMSMTTRSSPTRSSPRKKTPHSPATDTSPRKKTPPVAVTRPTKIDFVPICLPDGGGVIPENILHHYNESLIVGATLDFTLMSEEQHLMWLKFFSRSTARLNEACLSLQGQLAEYRMASTVNIQNKEKVDFLAKACPVIRQSIFPIFTRLIFASRVEVTTSKDKCSLMSFGLTEKCGLARLVFYQAFNTQLGILTQPVIVDRDTSEKHQFDTPEGRESLWFDYGIGSFTLKQFNKTRNTYTSQIREVTSKFWCILEFSFVDTI
jgi:hypothetical protein